jgi:hypothetical protein
MNLPFSRRDHTGLERRLRAAAPAFGPVPPSGLRARVLSELRRTPRHAAAPRSDPRGTWIAAAAALLVLASAWWLTRGNETRPPGERSVAALSRELLGAGTLVLALPGQAEDSLRLEAARLLSDTTRVAAGLVRGLPAPLRAKLERM